MTMDNDSDGVVGIDINFLPGASKTPIQQFARGGKLHLFRFSIISKPDQSLDRCRTLIGRQFFDWPGEYIERPFWASCPWTTATVRTRVSVLHLSSSS
jgi:hypothetical protein